MKLTVAFIIKDRCNELQNVLYSGEVCKGLAIWSGTDDV